MVVGAPDPTIYDWATDRDSWVSVDTTVVRYALSELRKIERPQFPQAHAEAVAALNQALRP